MNEKSRNEEPEGIAVVGMAGRFPGASNINTLWQNLCGGRESITFFRDEELDPSVPHALRTDPNYVRARGILQDAELFDAGFFGMPPRQAQIMDPQQRVFLELAWEALENAGYDPDAFDGSIGVYAGMANNNTYLMNNLSAHRELIEDFGQFETFLVNGADYLATRLSYTLNLRGPSLSIYTACSTSLVTVCMAFEALQSYQCDMALAGGVSIFSPQNCGYLYQEGKISSDDGHCRPFDTRANGTVFGNGAGLVVLRRLGDALSDGDTVYAVIRGAAMNNDGSAKMSFMAPSVEGQAEVIAAAQAYADADPETITYVEAHGTATPLGDPIEVEALTQAFRTGTSKKGFCAIGSIKSNVGHLNAAAGIAGFIKTVLALHHKLLPPSLHFHEPNSNIDFVNSPFYVVTDLTEWKAENAPLRAGVSSFGVGGTNAHVVLEEAPETAGMTTPRRRQLFMLSARTDSELGTMTKRLCECLRENPDYAAADVAFTLQAGRKRFACRRIVVCRDCEDAVQALESLEPNRVRSRHVEPKDSRVVFMFPGQAAQYAEMGRNLYESFPVFRQALDECAEALEPVLGRGLKRLLFGKDMDLEEKGQMLQETWLTQPAIFSVEYALAKLWEGWRVMPAALVGHSVGEYVAACFAGVLALEDALTLVAVRGRMMQDLPPGAMLSVRMPPHKIEARLPQNVSLAAANGPSLCVLSGPTEDIESLQKQLKQEGVVCRRLQTSHAFHSPMMEPIVEAFTGRVQSVHLSPPRIPIVSTLTGSWMTPEEATDPAYWGRQLRERVRFAEAIRTLWQDPDRILLEVGPRRSATILARQQATDVSQQVVIPSLSDSAQGNAEVASVLEAIGYLWLAGIEVDWKRFYAEAKRKRVALPAYPFSGERFWVETEACEHLSDPKDRPSDALVCKDESRLAPDIGEAQDDSWEEVLEIVKGSLNEASGMDLARMSDSMTFLEMGLDSLFLTQWSLKLKARFGVHVTVRQLLEERSTLQALAKYIEQVSDISPRKRSGDYRKGTIAEGAGAFAASEGRFPSHAEDERRTNSLEQVIASQLQIMSEQLEMLRSAGSTATMEELLALLSEKVRGVTGPHREKGSERDEANDVDLGRNMATHSLEGWSTGRIRRVARDHLLPLSSGQLRLWYLDQLVPDSRAYNLPSAFRLSGKLDVAGLRRGLNEIVDRHEVLRTTLQMDGDTPNQSIADSMVLEIPLVDLSDLVPVDREKELKSFLRREANQPFRLAEGPLLRAAIVKLEEDEHVLFVMPHHAIFDGWSWGVFQRELTVFYEAALEGRPCRLAELPIQYADFAVWQREWMELPGFERLSGYWCERLGGEVPVLEMPTDHPRPPILSDKGAAERLGIPKGVTETLRALGCSESATLFMVLLAAFKTLLYRYTGQCDILVGTPVAGRVRPETEGLIGFFVNTIVLRTRWDGEPSFRDLLREVRKGCLEAYSHQEMPFERLVQELKPERDMSRNPLYQAMFNFGSAVNYGAEMGDVTWGRERLETNVAQVDLTLWVRDTEEGLSSELIYSTDLFEAKTLVRLLKNFNVLLNSIAKDPDEKISKLRLLTDSEKRQLAEWGRNPMDFPRDRCLHEMVERRVERNPNAVATEFEGRCLTYRELDERANQLANRLRSLGVGSDVIVGIFMERSLEMVVSLLGVLKAGGAYLPLDPEYPAERVAFMISDSHVPVVITQDRLYSRLPGNKRNTICLDENWKAIEEESRDKPRVALSLKSLAYVIYTSGSTGKPKGAMIPHSAICNHMFWMQTTFPLTETDRVLQKTPFGFDASVWEFFAPLIAGSRLIVARPGGHQDSSYLVEMILEREVSIFQVVPSMLQILLGEPEFCSCNSLRRVFCGGEVLPYEVQKRFLEMHAAELVNLYGPTETTIDATYWICERNSERTVVPIGRPVANTQVYVLDRHGQQAPIGASGELVIGGAQVGRGYISRPELTEEKYIPDPFCRGEGARLYRTGDLVRFLDDGSLEYLSRMDAQVKVRGFRIELGEIESLLTKCEGVRQAAVIVREDRAGDARLVAYVVTKEGKRLTATDFRKYLRMKVPEYMVPQHFVEMDDLPRTPSGKIDRRRLPTAMDSVTTLRDGYIAPRSESERLIAETWQDTLGLDRVSVHDNFFEIGGHSLSSMQVIAQIARKTGLRMRPEVILVSNLEQMAAEMDRMYSDLVHETKTGNKEMRDTLVRRLVGSIRGMFR